MTSSSEAPQPGVIDVRNSLGVLSEEQCRELIEKTPIGRIGFMADGGPMVMPVNFSVFEGDIVFRTLEGQKLSAAAGQELVCFEIDQWDDQARSGWSVIIRGEAREVENWAEVEQLDQVGLVPWAKGTWRPLWVRIYITEISGRTLL